MRRTIEERVQLFEDIHEISKLKALYCHYCDGGWDRVPHTYYNEIADLFVEDVGRHNAVDAIAGQMWLDDIDGSDKIFYTTGRLTSEMVIKAAQMSIPFLVSRSGLTQMGHTIAQKIGIPMLGRATGKHYLLSTGKERFVKSLSPTVLA